MMRLIQGALLIAPIAAAAQAPAPITVALAPAVPTAGIGLRWSPKGETVPLVAAPASLMRSLTGSFKLGPAGSAPITVRLSKGPRETHYNILWVDVNRDGRLTDNEKLTVTPKEIRGKWWSTFDTIVDIPVPASEGHAATTRPYSLSLWYVEDPQEPTAPPVLRWSRRGWHAGEVVIDGKPAYVVINEMEMDGRFDQRDAWMISRDADSARRTGKAVSMDKHIWLDGIAYRPVKIDEDGRSISFVAIQPSTTEAEEKISGDPYYADRSVARTTPVVFGKDLAAALAQAKRENKRVLVDFEAVWCGPCHTMDSLVYNAKSVVEAATGTIAVKVDGDDHHDLKVAYKVEGYPTLILLDSSGKELRRGVGYQSVLEVLAILKP